MALILNHLQGLSDSKWMGIPGSVAALVGLDIHSVPGIVQAAQKLTKDSGSTIDAFVKVSVAASNGYTFWFSSTSGKIWARSSGGTWTLAYTTVPAAGGAGCLGAAEYNGFIYWATESRLHRVTIAGADDSWAGGAVSLDWATFSVTQASFHPMELQNTKLFIGDGNKICSVNSSGTFDNAALDIKTPFIIKCLKKYDIDLLIGTYVADTVNETEIIQWDCTSPSWSTSDPIAEVGINAILNDTTANVTLVQAGRAGNWYEYNGRSLVPYKRIPGTYSSTSYGYVHPNAIGNFKGLPIFGFSNGSGNPANQGVYTLGSYSRDYNRVLDLTYPISERSSGELVLTGIEIGAIIVADFDILVSWKNGSTFGVDKIDYTAKMTLGYFETRMLFQSQRDEIQTMAGASVFYNSLPTSTNFVISYSKNAAAYVSMASETTNNTDNNSVNAKLSVPGIGSLQIKVAFTVNSNDSPIMEALAVYLEGEQ